MELLIKAPLRMLWRVGEEQVSQAGQKLKEFDPFQVVVLELSFIFFIYDCHFAEEKCHANHSI